MKWDSTRVFVTGHTGFKGSWLSEWLLHLGAEVYGFSLPSPTDPALFEQLDLGRRITRHTIADVCDRAAVDRAIESAQPDFIFHLAAQSLVLQSYADPVGTFATNALGTAHVLDAARRLNRRCVVVVVTTDKCYENREWLQGYREDDPLGGHDPYSASKACAELVTAAYRRSFFKEGDPVAVASARAGNVIGGGDWARHRIVPDCMRALARGEAIQVRNPVATRPWQHVLEPLGGYLLLASNLAEAQVRGDRSRLSALCGPFNFGPRLEANRPVADLVEAVLQGWPGTWEERVEADGRAPHEAGRLMLAIDKAYHVLGWSPRWNFETTVRETVRWYREFHGSDARTDSTARLLTLEQIQSYSG